MSNRAVELIARLPGRRIVVNQPNLPPRWLARTRCGPPGSSSSTMDGLIMILLRWRLAGRDSVIGGPGDGLILEDLSSRGHPLVAPLSTNTIMPRISPLSSCPCCSSGYVHMYVLACPSIR